MDAPLLRLAELALLTSAYAVADWLFRRDGALRLLRMVGIRSEGLRLGLLCAAFAGLAIVWRWDAAPAGETLRWVAVGLGAPLVWKATTKDIDVVFGESHAPWRVAAWVGVALTAWSPAGLPMVMLLLTTPLGLWQHHATMPMRMGLALLAFLVLSSVPGLGPAFADAAALLWFLVTMQVSHYVITALAKGFLGPRWYSWVTDNRLHHLAASAYSWGWARFVPWPAWRRVIGVLKVAEKPLQLAAFTVELLAPLALLHWTAALGFGLLWSGFHVGVFLTSGLLFWEWVAANLCVAALLLGLPPETLAVAFGPWPLLVGVVFLVALPLRHKLWTPMPLGWWDTPLTQRMHWIAIGESGARYGVYNDFMCPHERIYGKVHGAFLAPTRVCTYHLGEVWKHDLRDAIRNAGPSLERLEAVRETYGIAPVSEAMAARHRAYLQAFFAALNGGAPKHVLPRGLRWLKAPGGQIFHWGELPAFRGQERVVAVEIRFREEYFDGEALVRLTDDAVERIPIEGAPEVEPAREPTPKELDDFLLGFAVGRLLELPKIADGFVKTDDGKARG